MSLFAIFSVPQAAVMASGEKEAKEPTPSGFTFTEAALLLQAEAHGAMTHSGGHGVQVWAWAVVSTNPAAKKKVIKRFFITKCLVSEYVKLIRQNYTRTSLKLVTELLPTC